MKCPTVSGTVTTTLLWLAVASAALAAENPCTLRADGNYFDLNPLTASKDYTFKSPTGREFVLNVCKSVSRDVWNPKVDKPEDIAGFTRGGHGDISLGDVNKTLHVRDGHPLLLMTDGSPCPKATSMRASSAIRFICDKSVESVGTPQLIAQLPPDDDSACAFFIEWRTTYACPTSSWSSLAIISLIGLAAIFVGLAFYFTAAYRKGEITRESLSVGRILAAVATVHEILADYTRDCFTWVMHRDPWGGGAGRRSAGWGSRSSHRQDGFERLPISMEEEQGMLGSAEGRFSLDDEEHDQVENGTAVASGMDHSGVIRL